MLNVRTIGALILGAGLWSTVASAQSATPVTPTDPATINQRIENQHDRIQAGIKDDQLTKGEATHLRADDAAIRAQEKVYRQANNGKLTTGERQQLNRELNRTSRQVYRDRHNNRRAK